MNIRQQEVLSDTDPTEQENAHRRIVLRHKLAKDGWNRGYLNQQDLT